MKPSGEAQNMRVIVRVRPKGGSLDSEKKTKNNTDDLDNNNINTNNRSTELSSSVSDVEGNTSSLSVDSTEGKISVSRDRKGISSFSFSSVLGRNASQESLYDLCKDSINDVMNGINCSILAYGQTGSGKTYSMLGKGIEDGAAVELGMSGKVDVSLGDEEFSSHRHYVPEFVGIVPRCVSDMFNWIQRKTENSDKATSLEYSITATYLQIYNEKLYDLLQDRQLKHPLQLRDADKGAYSSVYVQGLSEYRVRSKEEVVNLLLKGLRNRATRATELNNESSRSHTILQLFVQVHGFDGESGVPILRRSTYSFVDLAGSEKWRSSLTQAGNSHLDVQKEMTNINTSLHALGNCVSALIEPGRKHIPYRDSLLTRLLRDSLGGENDEGARGKSLLIATIQEDEAMVDETYSTLQFASRASKIKTVVKPAGSDFLQFHSGNITLEKAKKEISMLREHISQLEGAHLKRIEQANNPIVLNGFPSSQGKALTDGDVSALCMKLEAMLVKGQDSPSRGPSPHCHDCLEMRELLQQCHMQIKELFGLWTAATSHHQGGVGGYSSDRSQSSLPKSQTDTSEVKAMKKKTKKQQSGTAGGPSKGSTGQSSTKSGVPVKASHPPGKHSKRKASSASAAAADNSTGLHGKRHPLPLPGKKEKEKGISLPLLKSNSAGTYSSHNNINNSHNNSNNPKHSLKAKVSNQVPSAEEIYRQKKSPKKKKKSKLGDGQVSRKLNSCHSLHNAASGKQPKKSRYSEDEDLDDDLLGIINADSEDSDQDTEDHDNDRNDDEGESDEDDDDEVIMRRIEEENMKIIQSEDLARVNSSPRRDCSLQHQHQDQHSPMRPQNGVDKSTRRSRNENSIEYILESSRNAVLAANDELSRTQSNAQKSEWTPEKKPQHHQQQSGYSPARQSIDESHEVHHSHQEQRTGIISADRNPYQSEYSVVTRPNHEDPAPFMPLSSLENGAVAFSNKCSKHGLESCVLCTMFGNSQSVVTRSIHSPIKSGNETVTGNTNSVSGSISNYNVTAKDTANTSSPSHLKTIPGFCAIHHVNDCLLCSLTAHNRSYGVPSKSPSRRQDLAQGSYEASSPVASELSKVQYATSVSPASGYQRPAVTAVSNYESSTPVHYQPSSGLNSAGPGSNTTAPGMFTASPNRQYNFNGYNKSVSLASTDGAYAFGQSDAKKPPSESSGISGSVVPAQHVPSFQQGGFRSRYPVKSNPIKEESEHDAESRNSQNSSHHEKLPAQQPAQTPHQSYSDRQWDSKPSSVEDFEALLQSMGRNSRNSISNVTSKPIPSSGGIQFEDESDDVAAGQSRTDRSESHEVVESAPAIRTDHRRGNAMHRNSQSGLYEYDYKSKVEYLAADDSKQVSKPPNTQTTQVPDSSKPKQRPLAGANASAASVYGADMSRMMGADNKKAKKKQMNRKLYEMQKNKAKH